MRVGLISAVYPPEPVVSARITKDLADHLTEAGHTVTVLCPFPSRPFGAEYLLRKIGRRPQEDADGNIKVVRLGSFIYAKSGFPGRFVESFSFGLHSSRYLRAHQSGFDVIYANTWPLCAQAMSARMAACLDLPFVLHVQDIYPESIASKLPGWVAGCVLPPLRLWDRKIARSASRVVLVAERTRAWYQKSRSLPESKIAVVENWQNEELFAHCPPRAEAGKQYRVDPSLFTFLYLGSLSPTADLESVIRGFHAAAPINGQLLIVGDGSTKQACVALAKDLNNNRVKFLPCRSEKDVPALQSLADVCLLPLMKGVASTGVPSKLPAYMFSAKPVLAAVELESDTAQAIQNAECGWIEEPGNPKALAARMQKLAAMAGSELQEMGRHGREYALAHYSKFTCLPQLANIILQAGEKRRRPQVVDA